MPLGGQRSLTLREHERLLVNTFVCTCTIILLAPPLREQSTDPKATVIRLEDIAET